MNPSRRLLMLALLAALICPVSAQPGMEGVIRAVDDTTRSLRIDEQVGRVDDTTLIRNLDGATDSFKNLRQGQTVRYSIGPDGTLTELWVLPSDPRKWAELGLKRDDRH